ncbi:MAG: lantibiotic dehydratase family protein, partial [Chryseobacterium sp.]|nr:lantibiotic dehydratase family protein [Chryseobacterium sp.]
MTRISYQFFDDFVIRTPLFSFHKLKTILEGSDKNITEVYDDPSFLEALYLASPDLYEVVKNWKDSDDPHPVQSKFIPDELKNTLLKYLIRMSTRCTPFGLFSGVDSGRFSETDQGSGIKEKKTHASYIRDTRPDMHFLVALADYFGNLPHIKKKLLYYPNNSIYKVGDKIRYIEYEYHQGKRQYIISSAPLSSELAAIINVQCGSTIEQLSNLLTNNEITEEDAREFIEELIENQVLVNELVPNVSGIDFLENMISVLQKANAETEFLLINKINEKIKKLDAGLGNPAIKYKDIEDLVSLFPIGFDRKYLLQTDLYYCNRNELNNLWRRKLRKGMKFLNIITLPSEESTFIKFRKAFYERFEMQEVPLAYALDTEIGIGYLQNNRTKGIHPYLDDLTLPEVSDIRQLDIKLSAIQQILNRKIQEGLFNGENMIRLQDVDFKNYHENWNDLPDTISFIAEIADESGVEKLIINSCGGSSGANLLARFCTEKHEIRNHVKTIIEKEEELNPDVILAEIVHLPQSRAGNILRRQIHRTYEIPYLAQSLLSDQYVIPVDDLVISVRYGRIILRSKRLNKEIYPYLTNAHNYPVASLPIYHFLCDLSSQNKRSGLYFNWGDLEKIYDFLPRVEYDDIILSKARWKIDQEELMKLYAALDHKNVVLDEVKNWQKKRRIPDWIVWVVSDNKLVINLQNYDMVLLFLKSIKRNQS